METRYAGILGSLAFVIVIFRGAVHGFGTEGTVRSAILALCVFAGIGYWIGRIAATTVRDSVRTRLRREFGIGKPDGSGSGRG
ncbi:MAG TPA: hypothetical protein DCQ98_16755 [Planctomycetaceae bacterium]|nr:hypothetical protein [Planctomycetaceae bacterium]